MLQWLTCLPDCIRGRDGAEGLIVAQVRVLNYRYDGHPFWNNLFVGPVRAACGKASCGTRCVV